jgi:hypothetical protein
MSSFSFYCGFELTRLNIAETANLFSAGFSQKQWPGEASKGAQSRGQRNPTALLFSKTVMV